jgi:hypothetical protein
VVQAGQAEPGGEPGTSDTAGRQGAVTAQTGLGAAASTAASVAGDTVLSPGREQPQQSLQQEAAAPSGADGLTVLSPRREQQQQPQPQQHQPSPVMLPEVLAQKDAVHRLVSLQNSPTALQRRLTARNTGYPSQVGGCNLVAVDLQ